MEKILPLYFWMLIYFQHNLQQNTIAIIKHTMEYSSSLQKYFKNLQKIDPFIKINLNFHSYWSRKATLTNLTKYIGQHTGTIFSLFIHVPEMKKPQL